MCVSLSFHITLALRDRYSGINCNIDRNNVVVILKGENKHWEYGLKAQNVQVCVKK